MLCYVFSSAYSGVVAMWNLEVLEPNKHTQVHNSEGERGGERERDIGERKGCGGVWVGLSLVGLWGDTCEERGLQLWDVRVSLD